MENPALGGAPETVELGGYSSEHTAPDPHYQAVTRALTLAWRHAWAPEALGALLALRLDQRRALFLAAGALCALDPETCERLAEAALTDLRTGQPLPPFDRLKAEAELWASFASPAEVKNYIVAAWNALPEHDRQAFMRRAA